MMAHESTDYPFKNAYFVVDSSGNRISKYFADIRCAKHFVETAVDSGEYVMIARLCSTPDYFVSDGASYPYRTDMAYVKLSDMGNLVYQ